MISAFDDDQHSIIWLIVTFFCTLFLFVCMIKRITGERPAGYTGGTLYAADKQKKCVEKVNKYYSNFMHRFNIDGRKLKSK